MTGSHAVGRIAIHDSCRTNVSALSRPLRSRLLRHIFAAAGLVIYLAVSAAHGGDATHWSFQRLQRPAVPVIPDVRRLRTPIDAYILAELEKNGLSLSGDADRTTLVRRAHLDLIGLPPSPEQVAAFLADDTHGAYERLVDRLLASPHFGERWGRHWLDAAGYTDTVGFDVDANSIIMPDGKWHYRHYVIQAFNSDKPYDEFIRQQIAGDEMVDWRSAPRFSQEIREHLIATGFLRTAPDFTHEPESTIESNMYEVLHDTIEIVGTSLLGLTLQCARCHDHKFDPIAQRDYYRLMACLAPAYNPGDWRPVYPWKPEIKDRGLADISPRELAAALEHNERIDREIEPLIRQIADIRERPRTALREAGQAQGAETDPGDEEVERALTEEEKRQIERRNVRIALLNGQKRSWGRIQALYDVAEPPGTRILERGDFQTPGEPIEPGFLHAVSSGDNSRYFTAHNREATSGRRTALARWLTDSESPASALLARVMVNRVWQHLFGQGLVPTSENFGVGGEPPSHPELLEWLSSEFVRHDWSIKRLIRWIAVSSVYRQASRSGSNGNRGAGHQDDGSPYTVDPDNNLLWRQRLRRLDAEVIRDSILAISEDLNRQMDGPPIRMKAQPDGLVVIDEDALDHPAEKYRRSIYLMFRRAYNLSLLSTFDQPFIATTCSRRSPAAVVSQSLTMMNDAFLFEQAERAADRVFRLAGADTQRQIEIAFGLSLAREPNEFERRSCAELLTDQAVIFKAEGHSGDEPSRLALGQLCHALFNTSEFLYAE